MTAHELLADLQKQGFHQIPLPGGKLEVRPASKLPEDLRQELRQQKAEVLALLRESEKVSHTREDEPAKPTKPVLQGASGRGAREFEQTSRARDRAFLGRPLGQEDNPEPWDVRRRSWAGSWPSIPSGSRRSAQQRRNSEA